MPATAVGSAKARRLAPSYGPFGAAADGSSDSLAALSALVPEAGELWLAEAGRLPTVPGTRVQRTALLNQMLAASVEDAPGIKNAGRMQLFLERARAAFEREQRR